MFFQVSGLRLSASLPSVTRQKGGQGGAAAAACKREEAFREAANLRTGGRLDEVEGEL